MARLAAYHTHGLIEAGCDEAGRGCLAGPVVAAAVILPPRLRLPGLDDSKKLAPEHRAELRPMIEEGALAWAVAFVEPAEIDTINILNASFLAMHRAIAALAIGPQQLLIDGDRFNPYPGLPHVCLVQGDGRFRSIAAASVLAKTHRDELMGILHARHPAYNWVSNKGYPTEDHREAIAREGITELHRRSFRLLREEAVP
ncbi:MAG TPA: ribonuclease HII [Flavobacteriales bacterium]|nr:ribonuclease HII [Flavobacteriales bacterium]